MGSEKGDVTVITLIRVAQKGRTVFGMDLWYPHYYFVGRYGIPDFYKVMPFEDVNDIHSRQWEAVLVANRRSSVTIKKCAEPQTTTPTTTYTTTTPPTTCPDGVNEFKVTPVKSHKDRNNRPLAYELAVNAAKHEIVEVTVKGDSSPEILVPRPVPFTRYSSALNRWLQPIMPTSTSMTPHAMVFHTKKTVAQVRHILTTRHVVGRVWSTVFPQQDTYIYNSEKGDVT